MCITATLSQYHKKLDYDLIALRIVPMVSMKGIVSVEQIIYRVQETFGYKISYKKA